MSCPYEKSYKPEHEICPALGFQDVKVGVPVEIKPFAKVGKVKTECVGKPIIERDGKKGGTSSGSYITSGENRLYL